ncbi:PREDICTED: uncharacterized protein LOC104269933, partial [Apaloderma vittatum]|uniref:uncharacterized protein LOC104269933 n=1 Tax=Apaloderma vittatum TaxID=57397 RepID=UPI0005215DD6
MVKTMVEAGHSLAGHSLAVHGGARGVDVHLWPMEEPALEQVDALKEAVTPFEAYTGAGSWKEKAVKERQHTEESTSVVEIACLPLPNTSKKKFPTIVFFAVRVSNDGLAQEIPMQSPISITKSKGSVHLECHFKDVSQDFVGTIIHWYQQKANNSPKRILFFPETKVVDDGFQAHRYIVDKVSSQKLHILKINNISPDDTATYYCAYWTLVYSDYYKVFGTGTKLVVSDKGSSAPTNSEILQKKHDNQITYVCLIEKFYPEVIGVTWTDGKKEVTDHVVKGDVWKPPKGDLYSVSSWLTVPAENKDNNYFCKYEHETGQQSLPTQ